MTQPNFLIFGAQKSGTSWLARNIGQHPDVFVVRNEIHFFDKSFNFSKGRKWYENHFKTVGKERAIGEKTPDYIWANGHGAEGHMPDVHKNIHSLYPDIKFIAVLRNPVKRAVSSVNHLIRHGRVSPFINLDELLIGRKKYLIEGHGAIEKGMYFSQIRAYLDIFDVEQFLFLIFEEDIIGKPNQCLAQVSRFLGIDPGFSFHNIDKKVNDSSRSTLGLIVTRYLPFGYFLAHGIDKCLPLARKQKRASDETISYLYDIYKEDNQKLFDLLKRKPVVSWFKQA